MWNKITFLFPCEPKDLHILWYWDSVTFCFLHGPRSPSCMALNLICTKLPTFPCTFLSLLFPQPHVSVAKSNTRRSGMPKTWPAGLDNLTSRATPLTSFSTVLPHYAGGNVRPPQYKSLRFCTGFYRDEGHVYICTVATRVSSCREVNQNK